jgi:formate/nitrite transporter FocA (FNT family)
MAVAECEVGRLFVIILLTYVVAVARLPHIIAGSVEASVAVITGYANFHDYVFHFLLPTLVGNTIGGVALVGFLNHAPLVAELQEGADKKNERGNHGPAPSGNRPPARVKRRK